VDSIIGFQSLKLSAPRNSINHLDERERDRKREKEIERDRKRKKEIGERERERRCATETSGQVNHEVNLEFQS